MRLWLAWLWPPVIAILTVASAMAEPSWDLGAGSFVETLQPAPQALAPDHEAWPIRVRLDQPSATYRHDILGGVPPWRRISVQVLACGRCGGDTHVWHEVQMGADMVFEDPAPRLWDVTGDARPEIVVVETGVTRGARLAIWTLDAGGGLTRLAHTEFIGRPQRWLVPVTAADLDGDGRIEIAYVDRPHLLQELVILHLTGDHLTEVARLPGLTAHRIGDSIITASLRSCADGRAEILLPDAKWRNLMAVTFGPEGLVHRRIGAMGPGAIAAGMAKDCAG